MLQIYEFIVDQTAKGRSFLLFFCLLMMQTPSFAQNSAKITIQKKNISVIEALKEIEKQSDYSVGYNDSQLKINPEKPDVPLNKNDAFQKVQKRRVQEKR